MSCSNGCCSTGSSHHHGSRCSESCEGKGCGCSCKECKANNCCCENSCKCSFCKKLVCLADEAWLEVVKDKLKEEIKKADGAHIDKLVQLVSSFNRERWKAKMSEKAATEEFEDKMRDLWSCNKDGCK